MLTTLDLFCVTHPLLFLLAAQTIWELGKDLDSPHTFAVAIDQTMGDFSFPDELVFDFWGVITDAKSGRLLKKSDQSGQNGSSTAINCVESF